jgi:hypothetical protein
MTRTHDPDGASSQHDWEAAELTCHCVRPLISFAAASDQVMRAGAQRAGHRLRGPLPLT